MSYRFAKVSVREFAMVRLITRTIVVLLGLSFVTNSAAQGVQTGSVRGVVKDASGQIVPQVAIRAESPGLQGARMTASDEAGAYQFVGLAPGVYVVNFEFSGFQTVSSTVRVGLGSIERLDVMMRTAAT